MTGHKDWFVSLDESVNHKVRFADDNTIRVEGHGKVVIKRKDGTMSYIEDVLYVPNMRCNLLSLGQLLEKKYRMVMEDKEMKIYDKDRRLIIKAPLNRNRTFKVGIQVMKHNCLQAETCREEWLWHYRFGHLNFKDLSQLHRMAQGIPQLRQMTENCRECLECKQPRNAFQKFVPVKSTQKLEVIYSDVCGPLQVESLGGNRYFVTFIDDLTRMTWIYIIKKKNEVLRIFKKYKASVEKCSGHCIKTLRTDGDGEYTSKEFAEFCDEAGITHEFTPPYTPQNLWLQTIPFLSIFLM